MSCETQTTNQIVTLTEKGDTVEVIEINNEPNELGNYEITIKDRPVTLKIKAKYPNGKIKEKHYVFGDTTLVHKSHPNGVIGEKHTFINSIEVESILIDSNSILREKMTKIKNDSINYLYSCYYYDENGLFAEGLLGGTTKNLNLHYGTWTKYGKGDTIEKYHYGWSGIHLIDSGEIWLNDEIIGIRVREPNGWKEYYNVP